MNPYLKIFLIAIAGMAVSVSAYYLILSGYPYDAEDLAEGYFNSVLALKGIITIGAIFAISISSVIILIKKSGSVTCAMWNTQTQTRSFSCIPASNPLFGFRGIRFLSR